MNILIDYNAPGRGNPASVGQAPAFTPMFFLDQVFPEMLKALPNSRFTVVLDPIPQAGGMPRSSSDGSRLPSDPRVIICHRSTRGGLPGRKWWWNHVSLPALIKKNNAEAVLYVNEVQVARKPAPSIKRRVLFFEDGERLNGQKLVPTGLQAEVLISGSPCSASRIATDAAIDGSAVRAVRRPAFPLFRKPAGAAASVDPTVTDGKNYFLVCGQLNAALMDIIKGFSVFKKRQKSDWKLVLAGQGQADRKFTGSLAHYQYRSDLVVINTVPATDLPALLAGAYALVFGSGQHPLLIPEAFAARVPVIAPRLSWFESGWEDALLLYETGSQIPVAEALMTIYKDESLRSTLVNRGVDAEGQWSWQAVAADIVSALTK